MEGLSSEKKNRYSLSEETVEGVECGRLERALTDDVSRDRDKKQVTLSQCSRVLRTFCGAVRMRLQRLQKTTAYDVQRRSG